MAIKIRSNVKVYCNLFRSPDQRDVFREQPVIGGVTDRCNALSPRGELSVNASGLVFVVLE